MVEAADYSPDWKQEIADFRARREDAQLADLTTVDPTGGVEMGGGALTITAEAGEKKRLDKERPLESFAQRVDSATGKPLYDIKGLNQTAMEQLQELIQLGQISKKETQEFTSRLRAKRDVMEKHPIITQLGRIASAAATAYMAPGSRGAPLVHGAGAVGGEYFRDTPESLSADITQARQRQAATQGPITGMAIAEARTQAEIAHRATREKQLDDAEARRVERDRRLTIASGLGNIFSTSTNGTKWPADAVRQQALLYGASPEEAEGAVRQTQAAYAGWLEKKDTEQKLYLNQQKELLTLQLDKQMDMAKFLQDQKLKAEMTNSVALGSITRMEGMLQEHGTLLTAKNKGLENIDYWARVFRSAGVPGFEGTNTSPQDAVNRIKSLLSKEEFRDQNDKTHTVLGVIQTIIPEAGTKELNQIRREVEDGWAAMRQYRQRAPELIKQYDNRRSTLPSQFQDGIAELRPGGYLPLAGETSPVAAPQSARAKAEALAMAQPAPVPPTAGRGNPQTVPQTTASGQQIGTPTPGPRGQAVGALAPPNPNYPVDLGPAPAGLADDRYNLGGKPIIVVNGRRWGK